MLEYFDYCLVVECRMDCLVLLVALVEVRLVVLVCFGCCLVAECRMDCLVLLVVLVEVLLVCMVCCCD